MTSIFDLHNRPLEEIRLSLIDNCNYRCTYCMPKNETYSFFKKNELLTQQEIDKLITNLKQLGLKHIKITGGEPLLRNDIISIVKLLQKHQLQDLSLTTNGELLEQYAQPLFEAGLQRITVSLDSLDPEKFLFITGGRGHLSKVFKGIFKAQKSGLKVKINCLTKKNFSETEILPLVKWAIKHNLELRFIEYMDVGNKNNWHLSQILTSIEVQKIIASKYKLKQIPPKKKSQTARDYLINSKYLISFISSISKPFCQNCNRGRISAVGRLFLCLFSQEQGYDLKPYLQSNNNAEFLEYFTKIWQKRHNRYSEQRLSSSSFQKVEMYHIGG